MRLWIIITLLLAIGCAAPQRPFPLRQPMWRDTDLASVSVKCRGDVCAPRMYVSPLYWDGVDNIVFRPLSEALGVVTSGESVNVNSMDEVPDSSWFTNRLGKRPMSIDELRLGGCSRDQLLDPDSAPDGSWEIDQGKLEGSTGGFRVIVPGKGKYMIKLEDKDDHPERQAAASAIGTALFHAVGYNTVCEQVLYIRPSILKLRAGLVARANFSPERPFNQARLDKLLAQSTHAGELVRVSASSWLGGYIIGPFRFEGTRDDDPNDVIPHENRRELRAMRLLAAWLARYDAREENSLDTWIADDSKRPKSSPGHVMHYQLDVSEVLGGDWGSLGMDEMSKRLNTSYVVDWGDSAADFITLGAISRPWDHRRATPEHELFGYYDVASFDPEGWKSEYPNPAFSRMTERDGAWMARILSRVTPEALRSLVEIGRFSKASDGAYLAQVMEGRLERLLERYLTRLSPLGDVHIDGDRLCAVDLAEARGVRPAASFHYAARVVDGPALRVTHETGGAVCVELAHAKPYAIVEIADGVAKSPLLAHVYDRGGFVLAGIERPSR